MPSSETVDLAVKLLRQSANYQYFFDRLESADWIKPFHERGFFRHPPAPLREGHYVRFPMWVESRFLARVAHEAPELIVRILRDLPTTDNTRVHEDIVEVACRVPARLAMSVAPQVVSFLDVPYQLLLPEKVKQLITHLARAGELAAAVDLARALLWPSWPEGQKFGDIVLPPDPNPRFSHPEYEELLAEILSAIREVDVLVAYRLATELLDAALSGNDPDGDRSADFSYIWRASIEDGPRNSRYPDLRDDLVQAVRDLSEEAGPTSEVIEDLEQRRWPVFRRIALHVLRLRADEEPALLRSRAFDASRLGDPDEYHEFILLLRAALVRLGDEDREALLDAIVSVNQPGADAASEDRRRREYWLARRLAALELALPPRGRRLLTELVDRLELSDEALKSPDYLTSENGGVWVGPTSPLSVEEILGTPDLELVRYLSTWSPREDWSAPSPEGLGRSLQEAVKQAPARFSAIAEQLVGLTRPTSGH
jgi:hypothetical protein